MGRRSQDRCRPPPARQVARSTTVLRRRRRPPAYSGPLEVVVAAAANYGAFDRRRRRPPLSDDDWIVRRRRRTARNGRRPQMLLEERGALTKSIQARARQPRTGTISFVSARSIDRPTYSPTRLLATRSWTHARTVLTDGGVSCRDECRRFGTHGRQTDTVACAQLRAASTPTSFTTVRALRLGRRRFCAPAVRRHYSRTVVLAGCQASCSRRLAPPF